MPQNPKSYGYQRLTPDDYSSSLEDARKQLLQAEADAPPPETWGHWIGHKAVPTVIKTAPAMGGAMLGATLGGTAGSIVPGAGTVAGGVAGAASGGAIGAGMGSAAAQAYEKWLGDRKAYSPGEIGVDTALGAAQGLIPGGKGLSLGARLLLHGAEGAGLSGADVVGKSLVDKGELPELSDVGQGMAVGGATGALMGGLLGKRPVKTDPAGTAIGPVRNPNANRIWEAAGTPRTPSGPLPDINVDPVGPAPGPKAQPIPPRPTAPPPIPKGPIELPPRQTPALKGGLEPVEPLGLPPSTSKYANMSDKDLQGLVIFGDQGAAQELTGRGVARPMGPSTPPKTPIRLGKSSLSTDTNALSPWPRPQMTENIAPVGEVGQPPPEPPAPIVKPKPVAKARPLGAPQAIAPIAPPEPQGLAPVGEVGQPPIPVGQGSTVRAQLEKTLALQEAAKAQGAQPGPGILANAGARAVAPPIGNVAPVGPPPTAAAPPAAPDPEIVKRMTGLDTNSIQVLLKSPYVNPNVKSVAQTVLDERLRTAGPPPPPVPQTREKVDFSQAPRNFDEQLTYGKAVARQSMKESKAQAKAKALAQPPVAPAGQPAPAQGLAPVGEVGQPAPPIVQPPVQPPVAAAPVVNKQALTDIDNKIYELSSYLRGARVPPEQAAAANQELISLMKQREITANPPVPKTPPPIPAPKAEVDPVMKWRQQMINTGADKNEVRTLLGVAQQLKINPTAAENLDELKQMIQDAGISAPDTAPPLGARARRRAAGERPPFSQRLRDERGSVDFTGQTGIPPQGPPPTEGIPPVEPVPGEAPKPGFGQKISDAVKRAQEMYKNSPLSSERGSVKLGNEGDITPAQYAKMYGRKAQWLANDIVEGAGNALGAARGFKSGLDLSSLRRQGGHFVARPFYWKAIKPAMQALKSEEGAATTKFNLESHPLFQKAKAAGIFFNDESKLEENIPSKMPEEGFLPSGKANDAYKNTIGKAYGASNRFHSAFLNQLRMNAFQDFAQKASEEELPAVARYINNATGRGSLKGEFFGQKYNFEGAASALNKTFFSARFAKSRLALMNPKLYATGGGSAIARREAWRDLATNTALVGTALTLAHAAGADVTLNPTNPDFGKLKIGNSRMDLSNGMQPYIRILAQGLSMSKTSSVTGKSLALNTGKFGSPTLLDVVDNFAQGKMAPVPATIMDAMRGKKITGDPVNYKSFNPFENEIAGMYTPMVLDDIYHLAKTDPKALPIMAPGAVLGESVQTYGNKPTTGGKPLSRRPGSSSGRR